jgi:hypothetical protein
MKLGPDHNVPDVIRAESLRFHVNGSETDFKLRQSPSIITLAAVTR